MASRPALPAVYSAKSSYFIGYLDNHWIGEIAEVHIFRSRRTQEQIRQDVRHRLSGQEPDLTDYDPEPAAVAAIPFADDLPF